MVDATPHPRDPTAKAGQVFLILLTACISMYFIFLGTVVTLLWYYKGALGPEPKKYVILPQYLKDRLRRQVEQRQSQVAQFPVADVDDRGLGLESSRWTGDMLIDLGENAEKIDDEEVRRKIKEEKRISKLPVFVQDDCGDGSLFPDVREVDPKTYYFPDARAVPNIRSRPENYRTLGLKKLDVDNWLVVDSMYTELHRARAKLLAEKKEEVIQVTHDGEEACEELMWQVVLFLTQRFPGIFEITHYGNGKKVVRNKIMREGFALQRPWDVHPLEVCARLAMEDFSIWKKGEFTGEHYLEASATLFPAGWKLRERIGKSATDLHGPVPLWKDLPSILNLNYFTRTSSSSTPNSNVCMERETFFVQIQPDSRPLDKLLFIQTGKDFFPGNIFHLLPEHIIIRREWQTFRKLPKSDTIVFTVKTSVERLVDLPENEKAKLVKEIRAWPREIATYKGRDLWQRAVIGFCEDRTAMVLDDTDLKSEMGTLTRASDD